MEYDFSTKAGYQKFASFLVSTILACAVAFGLSQAKAEQFTIIAGALVPVILNIIFMVTNQVAASGKAKQEIKKIEATAAAVVATAGIVAPVAGVVKPVETDGIKPDAPIVEQKVPFNEQAFMDEVNKTVTARYTVANPSTIFYNAEQVYRDWQYDNDNQAKQARALLLKLADAAFKSIWGASYKDAWTYLNDPLDRGCPTCPDTQKGCTYPDLKYKARQLGMGYYTTLLDYERIDLIQ